MCRAAILPGMRDKDLYATILGIQPPWTVVEVELRAKEQQVIVRIEHSKNVPLTCPECGQACPGYDHERRSWRHLDTCQYRTILEAVIPRVKCSQHNVRQVRVPWAEPGSRFTALFEALVIDWLKEASFAAVARRMHLSWDEVDGIQGRAVARGLKRRGPLEPRKIGVDETSYQKRHEYVTVVSDLQRKGTVLWVADGRGGPALDGFYQAIPAEKRAQIEAVAMDMWKPYIFSTACHVPGAERKIAFDRFHVAKHLNDAVDKVRRQENRELLGEGDERLKGSKYLWLRNPRTIRRSERGRFAALKASTLKVARAWALKDAASKLWGYLVRGWAKRAWMQWIDWALRSQIEPIVRVAKMIRYHLVGILNADLLGVTNATAEGVNSKIQQIKRRACGFRNRERFRRAIYFHLGGLDLYPDVALLTHPKA